MAAKKRGLGRGLDALLSSVSADENADAGGDELQEIPIGRLVAGLHQPRRDFDQAALDALTQSIKAQGVVQPIVARPMADGRYEIVAGERRWRAAQQAGLKKIPAVVRRLDERGAMAVALVENIQRADLNPLEEAEALKRLIDECQLTHEQCAQAVGKSRVAVTHLLRLMELMPEVQELVRNGHLGFGHAKVLLAVDGDLQITLARRVVQQGLSVRQTEALLQREQDAADRRRAGPGRAHASVEKALSERIGLPVRVQANDKGRGKLTVSFRSREEMQALIDRLG